MAGALARLRPGPGRRPRRIRALLAARGVGYQPGASQPEARIAGWLVATGFEQPQLNVTVDAGDVRWELDGASTSQQVCWDYHSSFIHEGPGGITTARKDTRKALVLKQAGWRCSAFDESTTEAAAVEAIAYDLRHPCP